MLLSNIDPKLYSAIQSALFDAFAYGLGPDEWEVAEENFRQYLQTKIASQPSVEGGSAELCDNWKCVFEGAPCKNWDICEGYITHSAYREAINTPKPLRDKLNQ